MLGPFSLKRICADTTVNPDVELCGNIFEVISTRNLVFNKVRVLIRTLIEKGAGFHLAFDFDTVGAQIRIFVGRRQQSLQSMTGGAQVLHYYRITCQSSR
jgi:hypothetical protein